MSSAPTFPRLAAVLACTLALGACSWLPASLRPSSSSSATPSAQGPCAAGEKYWVSDQLYFGVAKPNNGTVSNGEWMSFLADVVTPRFPSGLSSWPALGQWRSADGTLTRENARVLNVAHADDAESEKSVQFIVADYKKRFQQEAVLRVKSRACVAF